MDYCIITESTADLTPELIARFDVNVIPMRFSFGDKEFYNYPDNREMSPQVFYHMLKNGEVSTTTAINIGQFEEAFIPILERGQNILYLGFSSAMSSTYSTSLLVAQQLKEQFPQREIITIDTLAASMGEGLLVCLAGEMRKNGAGLYEVADWVRNNLQKVCHWITVDDLMYLYRGGRVSAISAHVGTALGIKPILHVDDKGRLIPAAKVRGRKQSIEALADKIMQMGTDVSQQMIFIGHTEAFDAAAKLADIINKRYAPKEIQIASVGPVVGSHTGPGLVALFFMGQHR